MNYIDLGLSIKWADRNIGASSPENYGRRFTFDQAAKLNVTIPTLQEFKELLNKCTWKWTTMDGKKGYKVTGKNGNSIFLPAAGYCNDNGLYFVGGLGYYWSSTADDDSDCAYGLYFGSGDHNWYRDYRGYGLSVRPVLK